ncbi:MAG: YdcF family protein [Candidatus Berkelbacteria bacterium]|nr:YdcF family protein [Candidatus Berkelbacteria bacterium]MCR4307990.1 YdcF family protein [Candidatus Berkelbacteria bacterium]
MKYDAIIVLGGGLNNDGTLNEKGRARVEKAVEILNANQSPRIIFSGKWPRKWTTSPPSTEAAAMKKYAQKLGVNPKSILTEEKSTITDTNIYNVKTKYLLPNHWKRIAAVTTGVLGPRVDLLMTYILGPDYIFDFIPSDYVLPDDRRKEVEFSENEKINYLKEFYADITPGDHETISKTITKWESRTD